MIITYLRSSSYSTHSMCEQQYFIEYVLGWRGPSGQKADKGTIVHKALEVLALIKQAEQNNLKEVVDEIVGKINLNKYSLDTIIEKVYKYYSTQCSHHKWTKKDFEECSKWTYRAITDHRGIFDPRTRNILQPEQHFDIVINKPWAEYSYIINDETVSGNLAIKGTIDLITKVNDDTLEIIDWKTGRRLDWATGEEKTLAKLYKDPQLKIYHYAVKKLYPSYKNIIVTINFINDGGAFSVCFEDSDLADTEKMLREKFQRIKSVKRPVLSKTWKCNKLCHFGRTTFENTNIEPIIEYRDGQMCSQGTTMTKCEQIKHSIDLKGMDQTIDEYTSVGYTISKYKAPGEVE